MAVKQKKSELLRAGVLALELMNDEEFKSLLSNLERIKTGRPPNL